MALQVWLPLTKDLRNQGISNTVIEEVTSATFSNGGKLGQALSGGKIRIPATDVSQIFNNETMTIAFWYNNNTSETSGNHAICGFSGNSEGDSGSVRSWDFFNYSTPNNFHWSMGTMGGGSYANILPANTWIHFCITWNNGVLKIYVNGILKTTGSGTSNFTFDKSYYISFGHTPQMLNDFRIYDHCLSPIEIKELSKGLVLHYPLNRNGWGQENLYTGTRDFSGTWVNGNNWSISAETYQGFTVKEKSSIWGGLAQNINCVNGDIFTISFYAKLDLGGRLHSIHRSNLGNVTTGLKLLAGNFSSNEYWLLPTEDGTQWKKYWATLQIISDDVTYLQWRIENSVTDKTLYVCGMKLEKGSIATPWCPNSSDTLATTMGLNSAIEYDCSGFCNNGTRTGTFDWTSDTPKYNVGQYFNGSSYILTNSGSFGWFGFDKCTIAAWMKPTTTPANWTGSIGIAHDANAGNKLFSISNYGGKFTVHTVNGGYVSTQSTYVCPLNEWHHYVATLDGTTCNMYVDGVLNKTFTVDWSSTTVLNASFAQVGVDMPGTNEIYTGYYSDVRIYATALSADDIAELYSQGRP